MGLLGNRGDNVLKGGWARKRPQHCHAAQQALKLSPAYDYFLFAKAKPARVAGQVNVLDH